jgi:type I restriction enzyme M protein
VSLDHFSNEDIQNDFCKLKNLRNESDVREQFFVPLLAVLGFDGDYRETEAIPEISIGKGRKRREYKPDFVGFADKAHARPVLVVDTKSPSESAEDGVEDAQLYTAIIRRGLEGPKSVQYCIGSSGIRTILKHHDSDAVLQELDLRDFVKGNVKYEAFKEAVSRIALSKLSAPEDEEFEFQKPPKMAEVTGIFEGCHNIIRRRDGLGPESAFYEFTKIMFVKLNEDRKIREDPELRKLIAAGKPLPSDRVRFSTHWIKQAEFATPNPVNDTLFKELREHLEGEILNRKKKRIFEPNEQIVLSPDTVKEVVKLLQHMDLYGIDEDLNGRLFETFLSATMRGEELGQFFTPRTVVEFMTKLADLQASPEHIDRVLDACCGTGGFLIEAMTDLANKIRRRRNLTDKEKEKLVQQIRDEHLVGIDFGQKPLVSQIARINMYLHEDGGSKIYFADSLDKKSLIDGTLPVNLKDEREELKTLLAKTLFDVVLTNPPFSMPKKSKEFDQKRVLEDYALAFYTDKKNEKRLRASLESNVMFLERYHQLLRPGGKLLTIIDESVLNTDTDKEARDFILENFRVKAVISLPRMTFRRAGANVKTSILYLQKKSDTNEGQPDTFYALSENTGFDPSNLQRIDPSRSDMDGILERWFEFERSGKL